MKSINYIKRIGIISIFFFTLVFITYKYILFSFFQQDEWVSLGTVLGGGILAELNKYSIVYLFAGYVRVFGTLLNSVLHALFPMNPVAFAVFGIIFHAINSILIYILSYRLTQHKLTAVLSGIIFSILYTHNQAITWFAAGTTTLPSLTFSLLSLICVTRQSNNKFVYLSQIFLIISFLFKESSIVFFPFIPILWLLTSSIQKKTLFNNIKRFLPIILYLFYILIVRFYLFSTVDKRGAFVTKESSGSYVLIINAFLYPVIGISQEYIPSRYIRSVTNYLYFHPKTQILDKLNIKDNVKRFFISDILTGSISIAILLLFITIVILYPKHRLTMFITLSLLISSFIPLAVLERGDGYFDSRYFYTSSVGGSILFALVISIISTYLLKKRNLLAYLTLGLITLFTGGYLYKNVSLTRAQILQSNVEGFERMTILKTMRSFYPTLTNKPVLYVTGDSLGYYGVAEQKVPFQQGFGYTAMIYYYDTGVMPDELLVDWYKLWDMRFQGYWEYGEKGFGYFWSIDELQKEVLEKKRISIDQIYAVYYESSTKKLRNITTETRNKLIKL